MFDVIYGGIDDIYADLVSPGVAKLPSKTEIRAFMNERLQRSIWVQDAADGVGSGGNDYQAFQDALDYAATEGHLLVRAKPGVYNIEGDLDAPEGVGLAGDGPQGSNPAYGTTIIHHSDGNFLTYEGSGRAFASTGGVVHNLLIVKGDSYAGGRAIYLKSTDNDHRPGEMILSNILIANWFADSSAQWEHPVEIDGSASNDAGNRGVRTVTMIKVRGAACSIPGETMLINQATHLYMFACGLDQGVGQPAGIRFRGHIDSCYIFAAGFSGSVLIDASDTNNSMNNFHFYGKCSGTFINNDTAARGVVCASEISGSPINKSKYLLCNFPAKPQVAIAYRASIDPNKTGAGGAAVAVTVDAELLDPVGLASSGGFSCLVAGRYRVRIALTCAGLSASHTAAVLNIKKAGSASQVFSKVFNPSNSLWTSEYFVFDHEADMVLEYGDSVSFDFSVSGGSATVDFYGAAGSTYNTIWTVEYTGTGA